jgi:hypothetical protein
MAFRWKRWIALLLLMFSATTTSANVCSVLAAARMAGSMVTMDCHHVAPTSDDDDGTQREFCAFAVTPALSHSAPGIGAPGAVYVPPLATAVAKGLDPQPPLKPPPT